jgi:hypothetical protein
MQNRKFGNDEIDDLRGLDRECAFAEKIGERVGRLVIRDLENSLVDSEDNDFAGTVGLLGDVEEFPRLNCGSGLQLDV